jgi:hypothetical protein
MTTIQVGNKKRPVHTGTYMLMQFCKANAITFEQLGKDFEGIVSEKPEVAISFLYHAFLDGCRVSKCEVDFEEPDVWDWVDQWPEIVPAIYSAFADTLPAKNPTAKKKNPSKPSR